MKPKVLHWGVRKQGLSSARYFVTTTKHTTEEVQEINRERLTISDESWQEFWKEKG